MTKELSSRLAAEVNDVTITASDGTVLRAWDLRPQRGNADAVILLHGLSDNRRGMIGYAELLLKHGYSVLMPDARAHGASGGGIATYGLLERDDIRQWFEWLTHNDQPRCIFGFAESMGAAELLQALQVEPHFCAVAAESPFADFREIAYDRMGQFFHTGPWLGRTLLRPIVEMALLYTRWKYGFDLQQASPENSVAPTPVPVFLIHGAMDSNIAVRHSRLIANRNRNIVLWEVANSDHCGAISTAPSEFEKRLIIWFETHTAPVQPE